jgi:hypothetical protein
MTFLKMFLAASLGQIAVLLFVEGFKRSYFFKNAVEEITRWWDSLSKHKQKEKNNGQ